MAVMPQSKPPRRLLNLQTRQSIGEPVNSPPKLGVAEPPAFADNSHFLRKEFLRPAQEHEWCQGNNHRASLSSNCGTAQGYQRRDGLDAVKNGRTQAECRRKCNAPPDNRPSPRLPGELRTGLQRLFLLIARSICPRIHLKGSLQRRRLYRMKFVKSVLSQLNSSGGGMSLSSFYSLVHFELTPRA